MLLGKLKIFSGKEVCGILQKHGFVYIRTHGSHVLMQKRITDSTITIPVPNHKEIRIGTLMSIIRQPGLPRSEFES
ncbi:MAG: type II toxin-antitoxin system HicA family toxin [Spirochaetota bacterium]